ncbi:MAG: efflux RND transporter periplasmic adaptor subunit, partial [Betaproteobacteria bacterium]
MNTSRLTHAARAGALTCTLTLLGVLSACSKPTTEAAPPQPTVNGAVVVFPGQKDPPELRLAEVVSAAERPVELAGRLVWNEDATARVYPPFAGRVERLSAQVGQSVAKGSTLATLSAAELGQAQADVQRAQADERQAQRQFERARSLVEVGAVARKDLESAEAAHARAMAELQRAR